MIFKYLLKTTTSHREYKSIFIKLIYKFEKLSITIKVIYFLHAKVFTKHIFLLKQKNICASNYAKLI